jgi:hypothetical protein
MNDHASKAQAEASLPREPRTYDARSKRSGVPLFTCCAIRILHAKPLVLIGASSLELPYS